MPIIEIHCFPLVKELSRIKKVFVNFYPSVMFPALNMFSKIIKIKKININKKTKNLSIKTFMYFFAFD